VRVVGPPGAPVGFCIVKADELSTICVGAGTRYGRRSRFDLPMQRLCFPKPESELRGSLARSEMSEPQDSMRDADGAGSRIWSTMRTSNGTFALEVWRKTSDKLIDNPTRSDLTGDVAEIS
jgi:hypothetical protein